MSPPAAATHADGVNDVITSEASQTIIDTLQHLELLCKATRESQKLCLHVFSRIQIVWKGLSSMQEFRHEQHLAKPNRKQQKKALKRMGSRHRKHRIFRNLFCGLDIDKSNLLSVDVLMQFQNTLSRFIAFVSKETEKSILSRVEGRRKFLEDLKQFHAEIDALERNLNLVEDAAEEKGVRSSIGDPTEAASGSKKVWEQEFEEDSKAHKALLKDEVEKAQPATGRLQSYDATEALMLLKHEIDNFSEQNSPMHVDLMKGMFYRIVRTSKGRVSKLPTWFVPYSDVEFDRKPFDTWMYGTMHRGTLRNVGPVTVRCVFPNEMQADPEVVSVAMDIWFGLDHPHVLKMLSGSHVGHPVFVICNNTVGLLEYCNRHANNKRRMWTLLYEAGLGLQYLHQQKLVHADVRCKSIFVGSDQRAKLANFRVTAIGVVELAEDTIPWRAPECLVDNPRPTFQTDLYSFGMTLLEAVNGKPPWNDENYDAIKQQVSAGRLPQQPVEMDNTMWALVKGLCATEPMQRTSLDDALKTLKNMSNRENKPSPVKSRSHHGLFGRKKSKGVDYPDSRMSI